MEIQWGEFYFTCSQSVAVLIVAIPLLAIMQLPSILKLIATIRGKLKTKTATISERIQREERQ